MDDVTMRDLLDTALDTASGSNTGSLVYRLAQKISSPKIRNLGFLYRKRWCFDQNFANYHTYIPRIGGSSSMSRARWKLVSVFPSYLFGRQSI